MSTVSTSQDRDSLKKFITPLVKQGKTFPQVRDKVKTHGYQISDINLRYYYDYAKGKRRYVPIGKRPAHTTVVTTPTALGPATLSTNLTAPVDLRISITPLGEIIIESSRTTFGKK